MISRRSLLSIAPALGFSLASPALAQSRAAPLSQAMAKCRFISYQPTGIKAFNGALTTADDASIAADLKTLRPWFDGLITYSSRNGAERVPEIAARLGYKAVVSGIYDITDSAEAQNALAAIARNKIIVGCGFGNESIFAHGKSWRDLANALARFRSLTNVAVATTEPFAEYLDHPEAGAVLRELDFMLVNIHPIFETWFRSGTAKNWTEFVTSVGDRLAARFKGPILVKETGIPSAPQQSGFTPLMQQEFWSALHTRMAPTPRRAFSYFTAFDSPWRAFDETPGGPRPEEAHWGLFNADRSPKPAMRAIARL
jgi:glucan 1,3-beta-glucosidase